MNARQQSFFFSHAFNSTAIYISIFLLPKTYEIALVWYFILPILLIELSTTPVRFVHISVPTTSY